VKKSLYSPLFHTHKKIKLKKLISSFLFFPKTKNKTKQKKLAILFIFSSFLVPWLLFFILFVHFKLNVKPNQKTTNKHQPQILKYPLIYKTPSLVSNKI